MPFSGYGDLDPRFASSLQRYIAANPGVNIFSGYRTPAQQAQLFAASDKSGHWVGRTSQHVARLAADLRYNGQRFNQLPAEQLAALHQSAGQFGLKFPMSWEPWHVEPAFTRGGRMAGGGALPGYVNANYFPEAGTMGMNAQPGAQSTPEQPPASLAGIGSPNVAQPYPGVFPPTPPSVDISQRPMTPERFMMMMAAGQNPLRMMVFQGIGRLLAGA